MEGPEPHVLVPSLASKGAVRQVTGQGFCKSILHSSRPQTPDPSMWHSGHLGDLCKPLKPSSTLTSVCFVHRSAIWSTGPLWGAPGHRPAGTLPHPDSCLLGICTPLSPSAQRVVESEDPDSGCGFTAVPAQPLCSWGSLGHLPSLCPICSYVEWKVASVVSDSVRPHGL